MDKLNLPGYIKSFAPVMEDTHKEHENYNLHRVQQFSETLALYAKSATQQQHSGSDEIDKLLQVADILQKELSQVRTEHSRRKGEVTLTLPSPNTTHHLPLPVSLLSTSPTPSSPTAQQSMAMSSSSPGGSIVPQSPTGSISSPHGMIDNSSMSITSTGVMQADEYWRNRKMDPTKIVRRSPTPLYVNLTEQMILAQSSKRKRPAEGDLYCHNCKTKDTPEWRRGPMGAKTLCNACGIRWRLSQAEAAKQKKNGEQLSPTQTPSLQYPVNIQQLPPSPTSPQSPSTSPTQVPTHMQVAQSFLQQQQQQQQHLTRQQMQQIQQHQQHLQQLQQQYAQSHTHHQPPHPQQQHMAVPGPVGMAQENIIPNGRMSLPNESANGTSRNPAGTTNGPVLSSLSLTPIAT